MYSSDSSSSQLLLFNIIESSSPIRVLILFWLINHPYLSYEISLLFFLKEEDEEVSVTILGAN